MVQGAECTCAGAFHEVQMNRGGEWIDKWKKIVDF
jgi:putative intracellular protease/amidase